MMNTIRHILQVKGQDAWTISPDATVFQALRMMADKDVGFLIVLDGDELIGTISERDYARKVILFNKSSRETLVREIMRTNFPTIHPDQTVHECMQIMMEQRARYVPVIEDDGQLLGVISIGDVVNDIIYQQRQTIKEMEEKMRGGGAV